MIGKPFKVAFRNTSNSKSKFDLIRLEDLFLRTNIDHNIEKLHKVNFFIMLVVTEGEGLHTIDFNDHKLKKGTLLTIRKDQIHKFFKCESLKGYLLMFTDGFLVSYLEKQETQKSLQLFNELLGSQKTQLGDGQFNTILEIIHRIENEYFNLKDNYSSAIIRSELHILISQLYRVKSRNNEIIPERKYLSEFIKFQELIEVNVRTTNRVSDYASMLSISTKTLNTISKSIIDKNAKEFINDICIKQIKRLLINTDKPVKEISYLSGFEETTNFYKYFKKHVGKTPEQFRSSF